MLVTNSRLVNLIDVTLACEDAYSKLVEVFTVAEAMMRIVLATVCLSFGSLTFVQNFLSPIPSMALPPEAQKPKTFWIAAFHAQKLSGQSARNHFSQQT